MPSILLYKLLTEPSNDPNSHLAVCKHLIIQRDEQRADVLCLRQMSIEPSVQCGQHGVSNFRVYHIKTASTSSEFWGFVSCKLTGIGNTNCQQLVQHIPNNLRRMDTLLVDNWVLHEQLA